MTAVASRPSVGLSGDGSCSQVGADRASGAALIEACDASPSSGRVHPAAARATATAPARPHALRRPDLIVAISAPPLVAHPVPGHANQARRIAAAVIHRPRPAPPHRWVPAIRLLCSSSVDPVAVGIWESAAVSSTGTPTHERTVSEMPFLLNQEVADYKVDVFQSSTLDYDRSLRLTLGNGDTVSMTFPASAPGDYVSIGAAFHQVQIASHRFDEMYHLLQTEKPVFFSAFETGAPAIRFVGLSTSPESVGEGLADADA